ncbi:N-acetyltransferase family protein [Gymnodinialimonas hymeniacidonis]|uniref:GNAT family N-acetyltransferase n=1 Tax=Gymnodinialimonas hymeniacidonis TaxID=3126508 RepID=UPI0034C674AE
MKARALEAEDLSALAELRLDGIRRFPQAFLLTEAEARESDANLLGWITSGNALGLYDGKRLIGFAGLRAMGFSMAEHRAHLGPFYVAPDHHGTGAADTLLTFACNLARTRGAQQVELYVATPNTRARNFYARHGFAVMGQVPRAVIQNDETVDDLFMVRDLTKDLPSPGPDGLRRLGPGDWRAFRTVRLEMLEEAPEFFGSTYAEWAAKAPDQIMAWLDTIHLFAQVSGGRALATAGWYRKPGAVQAHRAGVIAVYTTPEARGRGLASALLSALEKDACENGVSQFELSVGDNNPAARAAYSASGYKLIGTIPRALNYSGTLVDQHEMVKPLTA